MPAVRHCSRVDTLQLKVEIERKLGRQKSAKYFDLLGRYFSLKVLKSEFDKVCISLVGRENLSLHNEFIRGIVRNACISKTPPPKHNKSVDLLNVKGPNGYQGSNLQSLCRDAFPLSPRKGRTPSMRERKFRDRPSPLGLNEKKHSVSIEETQKKAQEQQSATELLSLGSKPPVEVNSVEEGEEVEQAAFSPSIYSRSPVTAPLGISMHAKETRKVLCNGSASAYYSDTCHVNGELPDTSSLENRLKKKLGAEGIGISRDCVNLLNNGLDAYLKRLIKPCLALAGSKSKSKKVNHVNVPVTFGLNGMIRYVHKPNLAFSASMLDFRVGVESNPQILGEDWPVQLEKVCLTSSEHSVGTDHGSKILSK